MIEVRLGWVFVAGERGPWRWDGLSFIACFASITFAIALIACDAPAVARDAGGADAATADVCPRVCAAAECGLIHTGCAAIECGECIGPSELSEKMAVVEDMLSVLVDQGYMTDVIDVDLAAIRANAERILTSSRNHDRALLTALSQTLRAFHSGHSSFSHSTTWCREFGGADLSTTSYGVCAKPYQDHFVATHQTNTAAPLGIEPGERVVAWNGHRGADLVDAILAAPICGNGAGSPSVAHEHAAEALFAVIRPGDLLRVAGLDGTERDVAVGEPLRRLDVCRFPAGEFSMPMVDGVLRADGVAVIRLRRFTLFQGETGYVNVVTLADAERSIANMIEQVHAVFARVTASATGVVWDIRGNIGGASPVGFAIAAGMPGARNVQLARCTTRIANTMPIQYAASGPDYELVPNDTFRTSLPTAVVMDGMSISAADYFARAVHLATDARVFGRPSAGAYGGGGGGRNLVGGGGFYLGYDPFRCNDETGAPLETRSTVPDEAVEYDPADLAAGRDTILERAVAWTRHI